MPCYISSNDNRLYVTLEEDYGSVGAVGTAERIPAVRLRAQQRMRKVDRRDKTGTRTFSGYPEGISRETAFELTTYLAAWADPGGSPAHGPLIEAALGSEPVRFSGAVVDSCPDGRSVTVSGSHGLQVGQAVAFGGEIRFVESIGSPQSVVLNAPYSVLPNSGSSLSTTITYRPENALKGVSLFDYWGPASAVQRVITGCAINKARISINGDFHQFEFSGPAKDLLDSATFEAGQGGLATYPVEPPIGQSNYALIPGNLGQVWLGVAPTRHFTLTEAEIVIDNDVDLRSREFGLQGPRCIVPGERTVSITFALYDQGSDSTKELYQAARHRTPISAMLQLGEQPGQLFGIYMPNVVPEVPEFDDGERRLQWRFSQSRAQGAGSDEVVLAFA
ncbi:MAG: hypothetical protein SFV54_20950 [Bryobacteraceae bacterium]|nr:hypothetical protein [Bryobacteraceae bacterium]